MATAISRRIYERVNEYLCGAQSLCVALGSKEARAAVWIIPGALVLGEWPCKWKRGALRRPVQSTVALQAPHCVQWMKRPCTWLSSACIKTVPQLPHRKSMVCELATRTGGASTVCSTPVASTTFRFRVGVFMISPFIECGEPEPEYKGGTRGEPGREGKEFAPARASSDNAGQLMQDTALIRQSRPHAGHVEEVRPQLGLGNIIR